jgi:hypothetical protein
MMNNLNKMDNMMNMDDLKLIRQMIDYSEQSMSTHFKGVSRIKEQVHEMKDECSQ